MRPPFLLASLILAAAPFAHCPPNTGGAGTSSSAAAPCAAQPMPDAGTCDPQCSADTDCGRGNYCLANGCADVNGCGVGRCLPTLPVSVACSRSGECWSGCCVANACATAATCGGAQPPGVCLRCADGGAGP